MGFLIAFLKATHLSHASWSNSFMHPPMTDGESCTDSQTEYAYGSSCRKSMTDGAILLSATFPVSR